jgi:hypothetical protein
MAEKQKRSAGAGRGFVNPPTIAESKDPNYVSPSDRYMMEKQLKEEKEQADTDKAYEAASKRMAKGGSASSRADGIAQRGKTKGTLVACGGGYMKGKK